MRLIIWRLAAMVGLLLPVAGCGPSDQQRSTQLLIDRLQTTMSPSIGTGTAILQPLPDGARVTLLGPSMFPTDDVAQENEDILRRASLIQGLLDPSLMRIQVADTSALPAVTRDTRVRNVMQYFQDFGVGSTLGPAPPLPSTPAGTAPPPPPRGLIITISVECPRHDFASEFGEGAAHPSCR
jgi:hypothetical protein